ncbi:vinorine synthase-like [Quillaja saponaria]|uniref:Vinorine synthase-like n=1 Tax=Quillaja saponaria TaxID=32244 RepID=A0AAD7P995_QUISA|nr:vinorine synthase-like [Quillaja saponaria]WEU75098.1 ACT1 [Quillaja saponaria]
MKIETISTNCIKPSKPTPSHLRNIKLSDQHQHSPDVHSNFTFFYQSNQIDDAVVTVPSAAIDVAPATDAAIDVAAATDTAIDGAATNFSVQSKILHNCLATTLTSFYPIAGRFQNGDTIICNDEGAFFIEAKTDINMSNFLGHPDLLTVIREHLVPDATNPDYNGSILLLKFTLFGCGSTAITISMSHKIADLVTFITLLNCWTALARAGGGGGIGGGSDGFIPPDLNFLGQIVPDSDPSPKSATPEFFRNKKFVTKRFVFSASKIKEVKDKVMKEIRKQEDDIFPSRVDVVLALIWRSTLSSLSGSSGKFKPAIFMQAANLRTRTDPPLPETSIGNLVILFPLVVEKETDIELHELVNKLLDAKAWVNKLKKKFQGYDGGNDPLQVVEAIRCEALKEMGNVWKKSKDFSMYISSSFCNFLMNEVDFGWGKPVWVTNTPRTIMANTIYLLDTKEVGGVDALVQFEEEEITKLELNQELLQFATVNPIPIVI